MPKLVEETHKLPKLMNDKTQIMFRYSNQPIIVGPSGNWTRIPLKVSDSNFVCGENSIRMGEPHEHASRVYTWLTRFLCVD